MPDLDDLFRPLIDHPPIEPTPIADIESRSRRHLARKRALVIGALGVVIALVTVGIVVNDTSGSGTIDTAKDQKVWSPRNAGPPNEYPHVGPAFRMASKPGSGLVATPAPRPEIPDRPPLTESVTCVAWRRGVCLETQGDVDTSVASRADPAHVVTATTIFGAARWRREVAAFSRDVSPQHVRVNGRRADFLKASGRSGNHTYLQWEDRGVNLIVSSTGTDFTRAQLIKIAEGLRVVRTTVPVATAVAKVGGAPPRGLFVPKTDHFQPGEFSYLTRGSITSAGVGCLGMSGFCKSFPLDHPSATFVGLDTEVIAGSVPSNTDRIVVRLANDKRITFKPVRSGPAPGLRYFAHWLPNLVVTPVRVTALDQHGAVLAQLVVS